MKNLEICLQALQVGKYEKEIVLRTVAEIENCSLQDLSANRKLVADVFFSCYNIAKSCMTQQVH